MRSASNAYFAEIMSVISLPDRDEGRAARLDEIWELIKVDAGAELDLPRKLQAPVRAALDGIPRGQAKQRRSRATWRATTTRTRPSRWCSSSGRPRRAKLGAVAAEAPNESGVKTRVRPIVGRSHTMRA